ncbi:MAG: histidinol phosphate phosphatase domain-containing protein [Candidatus Omnitrophica bacterium]|jgi:histidinol phosphatase-like PHP family hydrolase|nr:histidinol phosphate phosphatase domain-containing protein [Candidatus Omnitrophota bacterium]
MVNLHSHSLLSDGCLLPSELAIRHQAKGYKLLAITDHVDTSNIDFVVGSILKFSNKWPHSGGITVLPGVELTHIPPSQFKPLVKYARKAGIKVIIGHGETPNEPVVKGTNRAAIEAGVDILAHPGLITDEDILLAIKRGVLLEITSRRGHNQANPHVAERGLALGAKFALNMDCHHPDDILAPEELNQIGLNLKIVDALANPIQHK